MRCVRVRGGSAGVLACEFGRRPAARLIRWLTGRFTFPHRNGAVARRRRWLCYVARLDYMRTAPLPVFGTSAKVGIGWVHQRVEAAAMQIVFVADEVSVRFPLWQGESYEHLIRDDDDLHR